LICTNDNIPKVESRPPHPGTNVCPKASEACWNGQDREPHGRHSRRHKKARFLTLCEGAHLHQNRSCISVEP
jgi:hypothetical protein